MRKQYIISIFAIIRIKQEIHPADPFMDMPMVTVPGFVIQFLLYPGPDLCKMPPILRIDNSSILAIFYFL